MKFGTLLAVGAIVIFVAAFAFGYWLTGTAPSLDGVDIAYAPATPDPAPGAVTVKFMGNTNLLFSDGETSILIDGYFTRPATLEILRGLIEPDIEAIDYAMERGNINELASVIPVHSHFDHAMDSPEVAKRTGAILLGSESTANIGRGWELPEEQIRVPESGEPQTFGNFKVTLIETKHYAFPGGRDKLVLGDPTIHEPLVPPVKAGDYALGKAYAVHIEHPKGTIFLQGSAGYIPNDFDDYDIDVLFLGVGGLAGQTDTYQYEYWTHVAQAVNPERIYPVHWDSLVDPLTDKPVIPNQIWSTIGSFKPAASLQYTSKRAAEDNVPVALLPMWETVQLFE